jgi:DNA-binding NarL/FixJ family response regulator
MRIILATADRDLRLAIELLLSEKPGIMVVGAVSETEGLIALVMSTCPDLVLVDLDLTGQPFDEALSKMKSFKCGTRFVAMGKYPELKAYAVKSGADDYVTKGDPPETLLAAVQEIQTE